MKVNFSDEPINTDDFELSVDTGDTAEAHENPDDVGQAGGGNNADDEKHQNRSSQSQQTQPPKQDAEGMIETDDFETEDEEEFQGTTNHKETSAGGGSKSDRDSSPLSSLVENFASRGVFELSSEQQEELEAIEDPEDKENKFFELLNDHLKESHLKDLTEEQRDWLDALSTGIPEDWYKKNRSDYAIVDNVNDSVFEDDSNEARNIRYTLIYQDLISKGNSEEDAMEMAKTFFTNEKDKDRAKQAKDNLKAYLDTQKRQKIEEAKSKEREKQQQTSEKLGKLKTTIYSDEKIAGQEVTPKLKKDMYDLLTVPSEKDSDGNPVTKIQQFIDSGDPVKLRKLAYFFALTNGFDDLSVLERKIVTKQVQNKKELARENMSGKNTAGASRLNDPNEPLKYDKNTMAGLSKLLRGD